MLLYSVPPVGLPPGVWGFCAARAKTNGRKNAGSHGGGPWRPHGIFFISQEKRNISRDENMHVL